MRKALLAAIVLGVFTGVAVFVGILRIIQPSIAQTVSNYQVLFQQTPEAHPDGEAKPLTLLAAWDIAQEFAHSWSDDALLLTLGRGKGIHFGLHVDTNGKQVITVVGSSKSSDDNQVSTSVRVDPATGQVLGRQELSNQGNEQDSRIAELTEQLQRVLDTAVADNQLVTDEYGNKVLAPEPAQQAQQLQAEIQSAYEEERARPAEQRAQAIENLQGFLEDAGIEGEIQYRRAILSPYDEATVEYYEIGKYDAMISMGNDRILQFGPRSLSPGEEPIQYNEAPEYSPEELEDMARAFIRKRAPEINLDELTPDHGNKDGTNYFFQWKRSSEERIHVGYTVGGDFLSYLDTLTTKNP